MNASWHKPGRLDLLNGSLGGANRNDGAAALMAMNHPVGSAFGRRRSAPEAVREDVRNGYVSPQAAADVYRQPQEEQ